MSGKDGLSLGDRMKENYENVSRTALLKRTPVIIRLDGKAFHTFTRGFEKPYDKTLIEMMDYTAIQTLQAVQGAKCAYVQSDEISILVTDYDELETCPWFDYNIQKMSSISAAVASVAMSKANLYRIMNPETADTPTKIDPKVVLEGNAYFDSRVFNVPREEVANYFVWRQKDWERNSIQMLARSLYSQKQLHQKGVPDLLSLCLAKGADWNALPNTLKYGRFIEKVEGKWSVVPECGPFTQDRKIIEKHVWCDA